MEYKYDPLASQSVFFMEFFSNTDSGFNTKVYDIIVHNIMMRNLSRQGAKRRFSGSLHRGNVMKYGRIYRIIFDWSVFYFGIRKIIA